MQISWVEATVNGVPLTLICQSYPAAAMATTHHPYHTDQTIKFCFISHINNHVNNLHRTCHRSEQTPCKTRQHWLTGRIATSTTNHGTDSVVYPTIELMKVHEWIVFYDISPLLLRFYGFPDTFRTSAAVAACSSMDTRCAAYRPIFQRCLCASVSLNNLRDQN